MYPLIELGPLRLSSGGLFLLAAVLLGSRLIERSARSIGGEALTLPLPQAIASVGLLLSGEAFGRSTGLPWGVPLLGTVRHPTQLYLAVAALLTYTVVHRLGVRPLPCGTLFASYLGLQGVTLLFVEALRADTLLLPGGIRAAQVLGLVLILWALQWFRTRSGREVITPHPIE